MIVKEGADSHPGGCSIMCTIKKLAEDYLLDFSLSLYPFNFGITHNTDSCDIAELFLC